MKLFIYIFGFAFLTIIVSDIHTSPDIESYTRIWYTPSILKITNLKIEKIYPNTNLSDKNFSKNKIYWFNQKITMKTQKQYILNPKCLISIYNERNYLLQITIIDPYLNFEIDCHWINEKLLYIQWWWGRIIGQYIIFDVASEKIILREDIHFGIPPSQIWHGHQNKK